jgi:hypothetical protein
MVGSRRSHPEAEILTLPLLMQAYYLSDRVVTLLKSILLEHRCLLEMNQEGESWQPEELALTEELIVLFSENQPQP